jgi:hypothetical protein
MKIRYTFLLAITCMLSGCDRVISNTNYDAEYQEQQKRTRLQMDDYDLQTKLADEQRKRFDKLLDKWEEQARRQDAIISVMEKQQGIKK